jgi:hypothetical protein
MMNASETCLTHLNHHFLCLLAIETTEAWAKANSVLLDHLELAARLKIPDFSLSNFRSSLEQIIALTHRKSIKALELPRTISAPYIKPTADPCPKAGLNRHSHSLCLRTDKVSKNCLPSMTFFFKGRCGVNLNLNSIHFV